MQCCCKLPRKSFQSGLSLDSQDIQIISDFRLLTVIPYSPSVLPWVNLRGLNVGLVHCGDQYKLLYSFRGIRPTHLWQCTTPPPACLETWMLNPSHAGFCYFSQELTISIQYWDSKFVDCTNTVVYFFNIPRLVPGTKNWKTTFLLGTSVLRAMLHYAQLSGRITSFIFIFENIRWFPRSMLLIKIQS